jgi:hypothetical protein
VDEVLHLGDSQYTEVYYSDGEEMVEDVYWASTLTYLYG